MATASCKRYHLISPGFTPTGLLLQFTMYTISRAAFCCSRLHYELHLHSIAMSCTKSPSSVVPVANTVVVAATTVPTSASSASIAIAEGSALQKLLRQFLHLRQAMGEMLKQHLEYMHMWVTSIEQASLQQSHLLESVIVQLGSLVHNKWLLCSQTPSSLSHQTSHAAHLSNLTPPATTNPLSF